MYTCIWCVVGRAELPAYRTHQSLTNERYIGFFLHSTAASFPLVATWWITLNEKDAPLTAAQVRRGAFNNSGTRDIGKDPNWNFQTGEYKKDAGYYAMFQEEHNNNKRMPGEFLAMPSESMQKHQQKIEDFAKGKARNNG
jgi:hypothetical protein